MILALVTVEIGGVGGGGGGGGAVGGGAVGGRGGGTLHQGLEGITLKKKEFKDLRTSYDIIWLPAQIRLLRILVWSECLKINVSLDISWKGLQLSVQILRQRKV